LDLNLNSNPIKVEAVSSEEQAVFTLLRIRVF